VYALKSSRLKGRWLGARPSGDTSSLWSRGGSSAFLALLTAPGVTEEEGKLYGCG